MRINLQLQLTIGGIATLEAEQPENLVPTLNWLSAQGLIAQPPVPAGQDPEAVKDHNAAAEFNSKTGGVTAAVVNEVPAEKPAPKSRAKKEPAKETAPAKPKVTAADVTAAVTTIANKKSLAEARALIAKYGKQRASEIESEHFEAFLADAKAILEAEAEPETAEDVL